MKFNFRILLMQAVLGMLLLGGSAQAASLFHITVNTSSLAAGSSAPFSLDFQFNNGSVLGNNTATVSNFNYSGGTAVGSPTLFGGAQGNIGSSVVFDNTSAFQELYQVFTPGTLLRFDVALTSNVDPVTPDLFAFAILDKNLNNIPASGLGDSLLVVNLNSASPVAQSFRGTGAFASVTTDVPEPPTSVLLLAGLPLLFFVARRRQEGK